MAEVTTMIGYRARALRAVALLWLLIAVSDAVTAVTAVGILPSLSVLGGVCVVGFAGFLGLRSGVVARLRTPAAARDDEHERA